MKVGDYARIGKGRKVHQVVAVRDDRTGDGQMVALAPTAEHPHAAVRMQDALTAYPSQRETLVRRRC